MKGLQLAEEFFHEFGLPLIRTRFESFADRIAAGLIGDGSECYGYDDEISMDHDWGPGFCLWLTGEDFQTIGQELQNTYDALPKKYKGFERITSEWGEGRVGVFETWQFYRKFIGRDQMPLSLQDWLVIPEPYLAACTAGKIFYDPLGEFTRIQNYLLEFYPEDIRLVKIAARCMSAAQSGQYNFMRCVRRNEIFAAQYSETKFCADIMALVALLNRRYPPYYKWLHRSMQEMPVLGDFIYEETINLVDSDDFSEKHRIIEKICTEVIKQLREDGLSRSDSSYLLDHGPIIHDRISDEELQKRNVWAG